MGKHHIYSYRLTYFGGTAPCYDGNFLSLSICKRDMRRMIGRESINNPDDTYWFIGIVGSGLISDSKGVFSDYKTGQILYVAKLKEPVCFEEYFTEDKFRNRKDRIYEKSDDGAYQIEGSKIRFKHIDNNDVHKEKHLQDRDWDVQYGSKETYSLISNDYAFLDDKTAIGLAKIIRDNNGVLAEKQGHRCFEVQEDSSLVDALKSIVEEAGKTHGIDKLPSELICFKTSGCGKDKA